MKQVAQNYRSGELVVLDVPAPACRPGGVLVRSLYSLISTGTEMMKVSEARLSLVGKARARPDQVKKLLDSVAQQGPLATYQKAMNKLDSYTPLGYSLAGVVVEVGEGVDQLAVGDVVAAAGNEFALHAELNWVPVNLCVRVPDGVPPEQAAFSTVGAIAMQGVRRAEPQLGEVACVIGLGLVGQLVVRLLVAAGVKVVGLDTVEARCRHGREGGGSGLRQPRHRTASRWWRRSRSTASEGLGCRPRVPGRRAAPPTTRSRSRRGSRATAAGSSTSARPDSTCRGTTTTRRSSTSASRGPTGPVATTTATSSSGIDYPAGYVRWTERRNLGSLPRPDRRRAARRVRAGLERASHRRGDAGLRPAGRRHARRGSDTSCTIRTPSRRPRRRRAPSVSRGPRVARVAGARGGPTGGKVQVGFIGAGNYATSMLLPHLAAHEGVELASVATTRSLSAVNAQRKFGFERAGTDADDVLVGPDTRRGVRRHPASLPRRRSSAARSSRGKAVFVEKPLALDEAQVQQILDTVERTGNDRLMVGFNRRFAPLVADLTERLRRRSRAAARSATSSTPAASTPSSWYLDAARGLALRR